MSTKTSINSGSKPLIYNLIVYIINSDIRKYYA
uniref:Uncharacterized protein n=1 Tax=Siphoviridae sp. ctiam3 TaxID=2825624 RepID=A0A8S5P6D7_9CAUD|nr:MAG TPA: hypothetical protein [Siphoviridae sp. ctiam3]